MGALGVGGVTVSWQGSREDMMGSSGNEDHWEQGGTGRMGTVPGE